MNQHAFPSDIAFTPAVKAQQVRQRSRATYERMEAGRGWATKLTADVQQFIEQQISIFVATANSEGQPYIQHRGGPPGFLHVLDATTLAFADFSGNRQYISVGNLSENPRVHLFLIDYARKRRIKIWGVARVSEDTELLAKLTPPNYRARIERAIVIDVKAWDANCPQHIPQRFDAADVEQALSKRDNQIAELEAEVKRLRAELSQVVVNRMDGDGLKADRR
jgi:predicted pyridoxine 5'-phosphate oxidase superfamily flavin-nucleotide-binding protein